MRGDRGPRGLIHRNTDRIAGAVHQGDPDGSVAVWAAAPGTAPDVPTIGEAPRLSIPIADEDGDDGVKSIESLQHTRGSSGWRTALDGVAARVRGQFKSLAN